MQPAGETPRKTPRHRAKGTRRAARRPVGGSWRATAWALVKETTSTCVEYRVTGLAAEAAFFTLLSIPPLLLCLAGTLGYLDDIVGAGTIDNLQQDIIDASGTVLSGESVDQIVRPLLKSVFDGGRPDLISIGFLLSLWSGSRALYIFIDTITVMYGLDGKRGIVATRALSLGLYLAALVIGSLVLPLLVAGPGMVVAALPGVAGLVTALYWPVAILLLIVSLTTLYHVSVPVRTPWREDIPGALVALVVLVVCSVVLRVYLVSSVEGPTVYGSLAAPVAVLLWIFVVALAVLIGAAMNTAVDRRWPSPQTAEARAATARHDAARAESERAAADRAADRAATGRTPAQRPPTSPGPRSGGAAGGRPYGPPGGGGQGRDGEGWDGPDRDGEDWDGEDWDGSDDGGPDDDPGGHAPSEYPERWADLLPPGDVRGRLGGRGTRRRSAPPPPDSDPPPGRPPVHRTPRG
ncbi:YihY/virulence factor BrkB family protein [Streptacidiphilus sp. ASG 303]|uniref:YihY/virulence factor BrkB family protein n=1 Tax=Streptacidiphilus sp. ASG 303 TaxID=2896847 RepID=UPI001E2A403B|nr:YihY/virulence factor BrkB family protein [Streptacidiphilus sp. ASG 303]MCD0481513.1 YihY/virulence factor BrkB family protein [Streptacidiphilus sp. ASG 303]